LRYSLRISFKLRPSSARVIEQALLPEMRWRAEWTAKVQVRGNELVVKLDSSTLSRLRAATNTILRWIEMVDGTVSLLEKT
jgi:tRNA threonylcarbamoyladenosine modification (KEOPS) complex  Pcc1 subunit